MRCLPAILFVLTPLGTPFAAQAVEPSQRVLALVVYGDDPCPQGQGEDIVVCARKPEAERYRIPKPIRDKPAPAGGPGWSNQVALMEEAGRALIPGSCSVNGSYGFTGCTAAMIHQWYAERRMETSKDIP
ncbi:MAG: hypothetical protein AB7U35_09300 [Sphingobium sp.]